MSKEKKYDPNKKVMAAFQIPVELKKRAGKAARKRGMSFSQFAREAISLCAHFDAPLWPTITDIAANHRIGESMVIQNIIIRYLAEQLALDEVFGSDEYRLTPEFTQTNKGTLTGAALLELLKEDFVFKYRKEEFKDFFLVKKEDKKS